MKKEYILYKENKINRKFVFFKSTLDFTPNPSEAKRFNVLEAVFRSALLNLKWIHEKYIC